MSRESRVSALSFVVGALLGLAGARAFLRHVPAHGDWLLVIAAFFAAVALFFVVRRNKSENAEE